jgi:hypothetical protein
VVKRTYLAGSSAIPDWSLAHIRETVPTAEPAIVMMEVGFRIRTAVAFCSPAFTPCTGYVKNMTSQRIVKNFIGVLAFLNIFASSNSMNCEL